MESLTLQEVLSATGGTLVGEYEDVTCVLTEIDTDSRKIREDSLFIALIGERFDAHDFLENLEESPCAGFLISKELTHYSKNHFYVLVKDTHKALGDLAKYYKSLFQIPFVAVTGSVGKTTSKDMIASVLSSKYNVHKTQGNFNNTFGLPFTIFQLNHQHEICVLEMGMDTFGEIDYMGEIVKPDVAVITNVGDAHIERLGSRKNISKAKMELLPHVKKDGFFLTNGDDTLLKDQGKEFSFTTLLYGKGKNATFCGGNIQTNGVNEITCQVDSTYQSPQTYELSVPALGEHMIYPTLMAVAVGEIYGLSKEEITQGVLNFIPTKMRMNQVFIGDTITILDDTYNANPQSMEAALGVLANIHGTHKIAILGDMFELGEFSKDLHQEIGRYVVARNIDVLVTVGELARLMGEGAVNSGMKKVFVCEDKEQASALLVDIVQKDSTLLFKASRGMALETLVQEIIPKLQEKYT